MPVIVHKLTHIVVHALLATQRLGALLESEHGTLIRACATQSFQLGASSRHEPTSQLSRS